MPFNVATPSTYLEAYEEDAGQKEHKIVVVHLMAQHTLYVKPEMVAET